MSELLDQWTERMTRLERAENLENLLCIVELMLDHLTPEQRRSFEDVNSTGVPPLSYVMQGVEGMIYELEQVR